MHHLIDKIIENYKLVRFSNVKLKIELQLAKTSFFFKNIFYGKKIDILQENQNRLSFIRKMVIASEIERK